ncbi:MAG: WbqC family protein [Endomicrobiales bacterium]
MHQPQYLPWIGYFDKIRKSDAFVFLDNVQYKKREFQNRNRIRIKNGWIWLTVPVITKDRYFQKISEVEINNENDWAQDHWKSIEYNYAKAPFFTRHRDILFESYRKRWDRLSDINICLTKIFLEVLGIDTPVYLESDLAVTTTSTQRIVDICKTLKADAYLSGQGGKDYMDESLFEQNGIRLEYQQFAHPVYQQNFAGFEPHLSIVDYVMNCDARPWE